MRHACLPACLPASMHAGPCTPVLNENTSEKDHVEASLTAPERVRKIMVSPAPSLRVSTKPPSLLGSLQAAKCIRAGRCMRAGGGTKVRGWRGCTRFMHSRSLNIDPYIPTMPGRSMTSFHRPEADIACTKPKRSNVFGESHGG